MDRFAIAVLSTVVLLSGWTSPSAGAPSATGQERVPVRGAIKIKWPNPEFRTLQSAIDAAPEGATVEIQQGAYKLDQPIFVRKSLTIQGAGSGRNGQRQITHLVGPQPHRVIDEAGNLILRAEAVQGVLNFIGADSVVRDIQISGFDAGIVQRDDAVGKSARLVVTDAHIDNTGRGILSMASDHLIVTDSTICEQLCLWNAISAKSPNLLKALILEIVDNYIAGPLGAGIYVENTTMTIKDVYIQGALGGAIVGLQSVANIEDSTLHGNYKAGIIFLDSTVAATNNLIDITFGVGQSAFGDGIDLFRSGSYLADNVVTHSDRVGVGFYMGASGFLQGNQITCCGLFDILVENSTGNVAIDGGANSCGCADFPRPCEVHGNVLSAPEPVGGLE